MSNRSGPPNGLEVFDTGLLVLLAVLGLWWLWRHPAAVALVALGLMAWWETDATERPLWPWLVAMAYGIWRVVATALRWLAGGGQAR